MFLMGNYEHALWSTIKGMEMWIQRVRLLVELWHCLLQKFLNLGCEDENI